METENNVTPLFTPSRCPHDWQPVEGWRAQYRCALCGSIGRKIRAITLDDADGPVGPPGITAYRCRLKDGNGVRCQARAVTRVDGKPRCTAHACGEHTRAARESLLHD